VEDLFAAKQAEGYCYWTIVFTPTGRWLGRYSKQTAVNEASKRNHAFKREHPLVGLRVGIYDSSGKLKETKKIIAVDPKPEGMKEGVVEALLEDGYQVTRTEKFKGEVFDKTKCQGTKAEPEKTKKR
jgi:hypothetical protein